MSGAGLRPLPCRAASEVRDQRSEVRGQRSEIRDQRSEIRGQRSEDSAAAGRRGHVWSKVEAYQSGTKDFIRAFRRQENQAIIQAPVVLTRIQHDFAFSVRPGLRSRVTPAKAGGLALTSSFWIPSFAGMTETVTQSFILDQPGKSFFFCPFGAKNISDLPEVPPWRD